VLLTAAQWDNYEEMHFTQMEHHHILSFLFVRGLTAILLVGGLGVEDQPCGLPQIHI
jgi:hypothetical protein